VACASARPHRTLVKPDFFYGDYLNKLSKYLLERKSRIMSVSFQIGRITLSIALVFLAGWFAYLGVVYHNNWAGDSVFPAVVTALAVQFVPWLLTNGRQ
jgi:hypothetical protein